MLKGVATAAPFLRSNGLSHPQEVTAQTDQRRRRCWRSIMADFAGLPADLPGSSNGLIFTLETPGYPAVLPCCGAEMELSTGGGDRITTLANHPLMERPHERSYPQFDRRNPTSRASGHVNRTNRPNTWLLRPSPADVKKSLANPEPSTHGPLRSGACTSACPELVKAVVAVGPHSASSRPRRCRVRAHVRRPVVSFPWRGWPDKARTVGRVP